MDLKKMWRRARLTQHPWSECHFHGRQPQSWPVVWRQVTYHLRHDKSNVIQVVVENELTFPFWLCWMQLIRNLTRSSLVRGGAILNAGLDFQLEQFKSESGLKALVMILCSEVDVSFEVRREKKRSRFEVKKTLEVRVKASKISGEKEDSKPNFDKHEQRQPPKQSLP